MGTAFFEKNKTTASKLSFIPKPSVTTEVVPFAVPPQKVALLTRFHEAWATLERTLDRTPTAALLCANDQWGRSVCPDIGGPLIGAWQQAALVVAHMASLTQNMGGDRLPTPMPPARDCSAVELIFNLYQAHSQVACVLGTIDDRLLHPRRVSVLSVRVQLELLIQQYNLSTERLRQRIIPVPCRNNPKSYPWRRDRIW